MNSSLRMNAERTIPRSPQKVPYKRLELTIRRFAEVAIPLHLELLRKHKSNIEKFQQQGDWEYINKEQINARRTVQQLKSALLEMDMVERQVSDEDLPTFLKRVDPVRNMTVAALEDFLSLKVLVPEPTPLLDSEKKHGTNRLHANSDDHYSTPVGETGDGVPGMMQIQAEDPEVDPEFIMAAEKSKAQLKRDLVDLNQMIHRFYNIVKEQQDPIDRIEDSLEMSHQNIREGTQQLDMAAKLKASFLPLTGALIGGCVAGPLGMMAGFKVGGGMLAIVGGGLIGYQGAKYLRFRKETAVDEDLMLLSSGRRHEFLSLPDLNVPENQRIVSQET